VLSERIRKERRNKNYKEFERIGTEGGREEVETGEMLNLFGEFTLKVSAKSLLVFLRSVGMTVIHGANFVLFVINPLGHEVTEQKKD
jgi:hypothetical protein